MNFFTLIFTCNCGRNFGEWGLFTLIIIAVGFVTVRLLLCIRWRWTSSSAWGSDQKWSDVFTRVNSNAHGPTIIIKENLIEIKINCFFNFHQVMKLKLVLEQNYEQVHMVHNIF